MMLAHLIHGLYGVGERERVKHIVMAIQMLKPFEMLQVGIRLTRAYAILGGKLADECHDIPSQIMFFSTHTVISGYFLHKSSTKS